MVRLGRKKAKQVSQINAPDHSALRAADPFAFTVAHRRLAWLLRLSVVINVLLAFAFITSMTGFAALLPLKEVRVALLRTAADDDRIYHIEPMEQDTEGFDLLMEASARRFVKLLLEIDDATQTARLDEAFLLMDDSFRNNWLDIHTDRITEALDDGLQREIIIETTHQMEQRPDEWLVAVDFQQIDKVKAEISDRRPLRAYLRLTVVPQRVSTADLYDNPLGITVMDMVIKSRNPSTSDQGVSR